MLRNSELLKQEQVTKTLRAQIAGGKYGVGHLLPPERALAVEFGVARPTLRKSLDPLIVDGVLVKIPGVGTRVGGVDAIAQRARWGVIGLVLQHFSTRFYIEVTEPVESPAFQRGYQLFRSSFRRDPGED